MNRTLPQLFARLIIAYWLHQSGGQIDQALRINRKARRVASPGRMAAFRRQSDPSRAGERARRARAARPVRASQVQGTFQ